MRDAQNDENQTQNGQIMQKQPYVLLDYPRVNVNSTHDITYLLSKEPNVYGAINIYFDPGFDGQW
jgi:hypothetical protein